MNEQTWSCPSAHREHPVGTSPESGGGREGTLTQKPWILPQGKTTFSWAVTKHTALRHGLHQRGVETCTHGKSHALVVFPSGSGTQRWCHRASSFGTTHRAPKRGQTQLQNAQGCRDVVVKGARACSARAVFILVVPSELLARFRGRQKFQSGSS